MIIHYVYDVWKALPICDAVYPDGITEAKGLVTCEVCKKLLEGKEPPAELFDYVQSNLSPMSDDAVEDEAWAYLAEKAKAKKEKAVGVRKIINELGFEQYQ